MGILFETAKDTHWGKKAAVFDEKKLRRPVHFVKVRKENQRQRDLMWTEILAANKHDIPFVVLGDGLSPGYLRHVKGACKNLKLEKDVAMIAFTSGSTGKSKPIQITGKNILSVVTNRKDFKMYYGRRFSHKIRLSDFSEPMFKISQVQFMIACDSGIKFIFVNNSKAPYAIVKDLIKKRITHFTATAYHCHDIARVLEEKKIKLKGLEEVRINGAKIDENTIKILKKFTEAKIYYQYGMTETGGCTYLGPNQIGRKPNSVGGPFKGVIVRILDEKGRESSPLKIGEISIKSDGISPSCPNPFRTGDIGYKDQAGDLYIVGRLDNVLKVRGYRINIEQIEEAYSRYRVCAFGFPVISRGYDIAVIFETSDDMEKIKEYADSVIPPFTKLCKPRYIFKTAKFPKTASGKIDRIKIKKEFISRIKRQAYRDKLVKKNNGKA